jgi:uncharacterized membrane protein YedE/YeeE
MMVFIIGVFFQWFLRNAIAQLAPPMSKKTRDKFRGDNWRVLGGTLGGVADLGVGVNTLGGFCTFSNAWRTLV